jgi:hypothetical protein
MPNLCRLAALVILPMMLAFVSNARVDAGGSDGSYMEGRLTIQRIEVNVVRSVPPKVFVRIHGVVLNGCTDVGAAKQHRNDHIITVTIPTYARYRVCTMVARLIDETVRLEGNFAAGVYTVNVNGVAEQFRV